MPRWVSTALILLTHMCLANIDHKQAERRWDRDAQPETQQHDSSAPHGLKDSTAAALDIDRRVREEWKVLTTICPDRSYKSCDGVDRSTWSDASKTVVSPMQFKGLGEWSTFKIETFDSTGAKRTTGGDSWHFLLRDMKRGLRVPVRVFDDGDGTYTAAAHILLPGNYSLFGRLLYR